jgi:hypothetical protein
MGNGLPAGVFDATVIVPSAFIVNGPFGVRSTSYLSWQFDYGLNSI